MSNESFRFREHLCQALTKAFVLPLLLLSTKQAKIFSFFFTSLIIFIASAIDAIEQLRSSLGIPWQKLFTSSEWEMEGVREGKVSSESCLLKCKEHASSLMLVDMHVHRLFRRRNGEVEGKRRKETLRISLGLKYQGEQLKHKNLCEPL